MKKIHALHLLTASTLAACCHSAWAELKVSTGVEYFLWEEFDPQDNSKLLDETGPRLALSLELSQPAPEQGVHLAYQGTGYYGQVDYDGSLQNGQPFQTETEYSGMRHEAQARYRKPSGQSVIDFVLGFGFERWRRAIANPLLNRDQLEDFDIYYLRLGLNFSQPEQRPGLYWKFGMKYPVNTWENAHLTTIGYLENPKLSPGKEVSFYGEMGYRLQQSAWDIAGYYDSYNFSVSEAVRVTDASDGSIDSVVQPESEMKILGLKLTYRL